MKAEEDRKLRWIDPSLPEHEYNKVAFRHLMENTLWAENGCWIWQGFCFNPPSAYGSTSFRGKQWRAHRLSFFLTRGEIPDGADICHTCDNMKCVNPGHLRADTHQANLMDASRKKRLQGQGKKVCKRGHPLEGDNLSPYTPFRSCMICQRGRYRLRLGWPEHLAFQDIIVPKGFGIDRVTGEIVPTHHLAQRSAERAETETS